MRLLIFAAKNIGLKCIEFILEKFPEDECHIVFCDPGAEFFLDKLNARGINAYKISEQTLAKIMLQPDKHYEWLLNLWGGYIFKSDILSKVKKTLNIHPAYLPYCRGRDPVVWALRNGYPAGVTLHQITNEIDAGPVWCRERISYEPCTTGGQLYLNVVERSWKFFCENWPSIRSGQIKARPQRAVAGLKTFVRSELHVDGKIDADKDTAAKDLVSKILAHDFGESYQAEIILDGKAYGVRLSLTPK